MLYVEAGQFKRLEKPLNYKPPEPRKECTYQVLTIYNTMTIKSYADVFWGGDLRSITGYEALTKRNLESKKMCQELEDYLKKRAKVESDYSKSLQSLAKCFKQRDEIGVIEATLNKFKSEIETLAQCHHGASAFYQQQSEAVKKFKEDQAVQRKTLEDSLNKTQNFKIAQLAKTIQLEKTYVRKYSERDTTEQTLRDLYINGAIPKEVEKVKNKAIKVAEDAEKADSNYRSAVKVLDDCRLYWEKEMVATCQSIQELDEKRVRFFRQELWVTINVASKIALDIDNSSESVRDILEKCDIQSDIQAFIETAKTGEDHPDPFLFRHYTKITASGDTDSNGADNVYSSLEDVEAKPHETAHTLFTNVHVKNALPRLLKKKS